MNKLALGLALLFVACLAIHPVADSDYWWHLKTGQWLWHNRQIPRTDAFSYTAAGQPWVNHEWLFQAILWPVHALGGVNATILFKVALLVATFALLFAAFRRETSESILALGIVAGAILGSSRFAVRPDLFAYFFAGILIFIFERGWNRWLALPVIVLWANSHGSFPLGLFIVAAYATRFGLTGLGLFAACVAGCFVNPYGFELMRDLTKHFALTAHVEEWQPTFEAVRAAGLRDPRVVLFLLLSLAGAGALGLAMRAKNWPRALLLTGLLLLSWRAVRFSMLFGILAAPLIAAAFGRRNWRAPLAVVAVEVVLIAAVVTNQFHAVMRLPQRFALGADESQVPLAAARALNQISPDLGPLFNTYGAGGPIIWECWPQWRVFVDGRLVVYDPDFIRETHNARFSRPAWTQLEARYRFRVALIELGRAGEVLTALNEDPRWQLAYHDECSAIFVRD